MTQDFTGHFMSRIAAERSSIISRRNLLGKSAVVGGAAALAVTSFPTFRAAAQDATPAATAAAGGVDPMFTTDADVLNYALTLEHLETVLYRDALTTYTAEDMGGQDVYDRVTEIGSHEAAHVTALTDAITSLGGTPVEEGTYDFGYTDVATFLATAAAIENVGVSAYAGAAPSLVALTSTPALVTAALGIHSVEARHAAYVTELVGDPTMSPFPNAVDSPRTPAEVLEIATPFITG